MGSNEPEKAHIVCIPFPSQGHVTPFMHLTKLLHSRGFHITYVNSEHNHRRLLRSKGPGFLQGFPDFKFEAIPDGLPPTDHDASQDLWPLCDAIRKHCLAPLRELVAKLRSSAEVPPVTCVLTDGAMCFAIEGGEEVGIPVVAFWTASSVGLMAYLHYGELIDRGIVPFKDESFKSDGTLDTPINWVPGLRNMRLRDFPYFIRTTDINDIMLNYLKDESEACTRATAVVFNTFDEFEHEVLEALKAKFLPRMYTIGPLSSLVKHVPETPLKQIRSNLWKEDSSCLQWLDTRKPNSVVYVNYGSLAMLTDQNLIEFAWGLANSKHPFLWIVRPDIVMGDSPILPLEFFEEIKDRGLLAQWCPQDLVLSHVSIGVFLTHCGWNSVMESVIGGVPVICWPFFSEQTINCRYACTEWGIGLEVERDVKREEVAEVVREMMGGEKGKEKKMAAEEWKKKAKAATDVGGSSYVNFDRFIEEVLRHGN